MTTAYHPPHIGPYHSQVLPLYHSRLAQVRCPMPAMTEGAIRGSGYGRYPQHQMCAVSQPQPRDTALVVTRQHIPSQDHASQRITPTIDDSRKTQSAGPSAEKELVHHSLQVPTCINPKGGNLADFAAEMTCLFWFESMDTLQAAEKIRSRPAYAAVPPLTKYAKPYPAFKKWAYGVLSTTQVTQSVILLALMFVYRLKKANPSVKGRSGSEYRLLTVALMLGNKFLDDNTYTNKTWAEVSGISVQEIHVMEVEFLSNMRYSLLATKDEWEDWLAKLACFSEYYERALAQPTSPVGPCSPTARFTSPSLAPTRGAGVHSTTQSATPTTTHLYSPHSTAQVNGHEWVGLSPLSAKSNIQRPSKKRAQEEEPSEHPAKRPAVRHPQQPHPARPPVVGEQPIRLPVPHLSLNTNTSISSQAPYVAPIIFPTQVNVSLPPLGSNVRAMATVYSNAPGIPASSTGQLSLPAAPGTAPVGPQAALTSTNGISVHPTIGYGTPNRRQSPGTLAAFGSSPLIDMYTSGSGVHTPITHTPISHSPSVYLQQRPSPYKPVRHVNTLLYPPPSTSLHEYHMSAPQPQMHYQPLGRRNDLRTGVVPEYMSLSYRTGQPAQVVPHSHPRGPHLN
ncbi:cyclin [Sodiomyces alkalinus F11]|uniref:Cyclin n=1 Tax=Sodiomyces alkalinus (strain CBS 110278 / VKM F-3762 / F11) TaxID=1314773 RepID=A0A3N2PU96_SODAK|nr:cyclin [Sodiomyces alkalinus F11]ROT38079.1 cyclin [Sodiomyces alkalinus F11]